MRVVRGYTGMNSSHTPTPLAGRREWVALAVIALPCLLYSMDLSVLYLALGIWGFEFAQRVRRLASSSSDSSSGPEATGIQAAMVVSEVEPIAAIRGTSTVIASGPARRGRNQR